MPSLACSRRSLRAVLGIAALVGPAVCLPPVPVAASPSCAPTCLPHLVPQMPTAITPDQHAPVFVDLVEAPGHVLYRFDTVIQNTGGALDLFSTNPTSSPPWPAIAQNDVKQVIWANNGVPSGAPQDSNSAPSLPSPAIAAIEDRSVATPGATMVYDPMGGHHHWHFLQAAKYELLVPGEAPRGSGKVVGFCMVDSYGPMTPGAISYYPETTGGVPNPWCQPFKSPEDGGANPATVRGGISPGWGDYYSAQDAGQWVDVTGLVPGTYTLRDTVNPNGYVDASPGTDNVMEALRVIPGVTASGVAQSVSSRGASQIALSGSILAPDVPARVSDAPPVCDVDHLLPTTPLAACYATDAPDAATAGPLHFSVVQPPAHGQVTITDGGGLGGVATYAPAAGYSGSDSFTYTAADRRGLVSLPANVSLTVTTASPGGPTPGGSRRPAGGGDFAPRLVLSATVVAGRPFALMVRFAHRVCGARLTLLGARTKGRTRPRAGYRRLAGRRVGCAAAAKLDVRPLSAGTWSLRVLVQAGGRRELSPPWRLVVRRRR